MLYGAGLPRRELLMPQLIFPQMTVSEVSVVRPAVVIKVNNTTPLYILRHPLCLHGNDGVASGAPIEFPHIRPPYFHADIPNRRWHLLRRRLPPPSPELVSAPTALCITVEYRNTMGLVGDAPLAR